MIQSKYPFIRETNAVVINDSVSQQRSINETLTSEFMNKSKKKQLRIHKSHNNLQPMFLQDTKYGTQSEQRFGFGLTGQGTFIKTHVIRKEDIEEVNKQLTQFLYPAQNQSYIKPKPTLQPLNSEKAYTLDVLRNINESVDQSLVQKHNQFLMNLKNKTDSIRQHNNSIESCHSIIPSKAHDFYKSFNYSKIHQHGSEISLIAREDSVFQPSQPLIENESLINSKVKNFLPISNSEKIQHLLQLMQVFENSLKEKFLILDDEPSQSLISKFQTLRSQCHLVINSVLQIITTVSEKLIKSEETLENYNKTQENNKKFQNEMQYLIKQKDEQIKILQEQLNKKNNAQNSKANESRLRVAQLEKELEMSKEKLGQLLQEGPNGSVALSLNAEIEKLKEQIKKLHFDRFEKDQKYDKLMSDTMSLKHQIVKHEKALNNQDEKIMKYEKERKTFDDQVAFYENKANQARESSGMAQEETLMIKYITYEYTKSMQKNIDRIKMLQNRVDDLTIKRSKELDAPFSSTIPQDIQVISAIKQIVDSDKKYRKTMMSNFQQNMDQYDYKNFGQQQRKIVNGVSNDGVNLSTLRLNYNSFFSMLDKRQLELEWPHLASRPLSNYLMGQIRAIMDGMYCQFQLLQLGHKNIPSFQAYVYQWLCNFEIDEKHQCVVRHPDDFSKIKLDEYLLNFYLDLHVTRLDKVWEVQQFRNFLNDYYGMEELYFYLHARQMIRRGPWLPTFCSITSVVHYMRVDQAISFMKRYLKLFDEINEELIMRAMMERVKIQGEHKIIQTGFVLQMLVEIFRIELQNRFKALSTSFPKAPVSFRAFHRFVKGNYDKFTDESEIAELWRETNLLTQNHASLAAFFTVSSFLFIKTLTLPTLWQDHITNSEEDPTLQYTEQNYSILQCAELIEEMGDSDRDKFITHDIVQMGSEELVKAAQLLRKPNGNSPPAVQLAGTICTMALRWLYFQQHSNGINDSGYVTASIDLKKILQFVQGAVKESATKNRELKSLIDYKSLRIARVQRYAKKKFVKFYLMIASNLEATMRHKEETKQEKKLK